MNRQQQINASKKASQVYGLRVRGWRVTEIASSLGIPERTVYYLLAEGDRITDGRIRSLNRDGALRQLLLAHEERERKLWDLLTTAKLEIVKTQCLRQMIDEEKRFEELLVRLSVLQKATDIKTEHDINITERKDLRIRIDVRYSDSQLADRVPDFVGRLRRPGALDCAAPA